MTTANNTLPAATTNDPTTKRPRAKVLCIDDDPHVSHGMQLWLNQFEVEVLHAHFGMQGVALAISEQPDAIITDIRMPQGEGDHVEHESHMLLVIARRAPWRSDLLAGCRLRFPSARVGLPEKKKAS